MQGEVQVKITYSKKCVIFLDVFILSGIFGSVLTFVLYLVTGSPSGTHLHTEPKHIVFLSQLFCCLDFATAVSAIIQ